MFYYIGGRPGSLAPNLKKEFFDVRNLKSIQKLIQMMKGMDKLTLEWIKCGSRRLFLVESLI